jgi:hypothetical protein
MGNKNMCKREDNKGKQSTVCEEIISMYHGKGEIIIYGAELGKYGFRTKI